MADEEDNQFNALKARVAAARATAAGSIRSPQIPPDESSAPWATPRPPAPERAATPPERRLPSYAELMGTAVPKVPSVSLPQNGNGKGRVARMQGRDKTPPTEVAWKLVDKLMQRWSETSKENLGRANSWLSQQWAKNATFFIRNNLPLDKFEEVIKVCVALAKDNLGEVEEDRRIEEIRQRGMREMSEFEAAEVEEEEGDDDGGGG